jgi:hypothetical protein
MLLCVEQCTKMTVMSGCCMLLFLFVSLIITVISCSPILLKLLTELLLQGIKCPESWCNNGVIISRLRSINNISTSISCSMMMIMMISSSSKVLWPAAWWLQAHIQS